MTGSLANLPHFGGGRKGLFVLLRYLFIIGASYLLVFGSPPGGFSTIPALVVAAALTSNVVLSVMRPETVFSWYVEAPVLVADTLWVSWALHSTGTMGQEFFLLYFFVLFLAALGENLVIALLGSTVVSIANVYFINPPLWTAPHLLRIVFFYAVTLFYGGILIEIKRERQRADDGFTWAKGLEEKVAERTDELRRLYQEAQTANRLKSDFISTMSHELRTPLHVIMGYTDLLLEREFGALTGEQDKILRVITKHQLELRDLINATLDLGRMEAGKVDLQLSTVDVTDLLRRLEEEIRTAWSNPDVQLTWIVPVDLPQLNTDPNKLKAVLKNLLDNAAKFTESGSASLTARATHDGVEVLVTDTGIGIPANKHSLIFEAFRQVDSSTTRRYGGVGLGLYIVSRLIEVMGGTISLESQLGRGSTFRVWLPTGGPPAAAA